MQLIQAAARARKLPLNEMAGAHNRIATWLVDLLESDNNTYTGLRTFAPELSRISDNLPDAEAYAINALIGYVQNEVRDTIVGSDHMTLDELNNYCFRNYGLGVAVRWTRLTPRRD